MFKVELNYRSAEAWDWKKEVHDLKVLPNQGEFLSVNTAENWLKVEMVVHQTVEADYSAVLYAVDAGMALQYHGDIENLN